MKKTLLLTAICGGLFSLSGFAQATVVVNGDLTSYSTTSSHVPVAPGVNGFGTVDTVMIGVGVIPDSVSFNVSGALTSIFSVNLGAISDGPFDFVETSSGSGVFENSDPVLLAQFEGWNNVVTGTLTGASNFSTSVESFNVQSIPEPSVVLLGFLGIFPLLRRRR